MKESNGFYNPIRFQYQMASMVRISIFCAAFLMLCGCAMHPPVPESEIKSPSPASQMIRFYQGPLDHLAAVRYGGCPMHPGCSAYAASAIETHGGLMGWIMTFDRLIRCGGDETRFSTEMLADGQWKYADSLAHNNFWWFPQPADAGINEVDTPVPPTDWGVSVE